MSTELHDRAQRRRGLYVVALLEGAKGLLVLLAGFGILALIHKDIHQLAAQIIEHFHLNPAKKYPQIFLDATDRVTDAKLWLLAGTAFVYAGARIAEAVGLWLGRRWAEWFGVLTGALYIPMEIYELLKGGSWMKVTILILNVWVVVFLLVTLFRGQGHGIHPAIEK